MRPGFTISISSSSAPARARSLTSTGGNSAARARTTTHQMAAQPTEAQPTPPRPHGMPAPEGRPVVRTLGREQELAVLAGAWRLHQEQVGPAATAESEAPPTRLALRVGAAAVERPLRQEVRAARKRPRPREDPAAAASHPQPAPAWPTPAEQGPAAPRPAATRRGARPRAPPPVVVATSAPITAAASRSSWVCCSACCSRCAALGKQATRCGASTPGSMEIRASGSMPPTANAPMGLNRGHQGPWRCRYHAVMRFSAANRVQTGEKGPRR